MSAPAPNYVYVIKSAGTMTAGSPEHVECTLRDLLKNLEPWISSASWSIGVEPVSRG